MGAKTEDLVGRTIKSAELTGDDGVLTLRLDDGTELVVRAFHRRYLAPRPPALVLDLILRGYRPEEAA